MASLDLKDDRHRYVVKPCEQFQDPRLASLLFQVADSRLPRLFGRSGRNPADSSFHFLPYIEPAAIGLDQYRQTAARSLLVFEYIAGRSLNEVEAFSPEEAVRLHETYMALTRRLYSIVGRNVLHLDLKPSNIVMTPDGSFCFIDWALGLVGEGVQRVVAGTKGYLGNDPKMATWRRDRYALSVTILSLLREKSSARLNRLDAFFALRALPADLRMKLKRDLAFGDLKPVRRELKKSAKKKASDEKTTVIVIPWQEAINKRNIRISIDE